MFISAAHDATAEVRLYGILSLQKLGADAKPAIPTLLWALTSSQAGKKTNSTWYVHAHALIALGMMGQEARDVLPAIKARLNDTESYTSMQAAVAVWRINHDFQTVFPVLTNLLPTFDEESKGQISRLLGKWVPTLPLRFHSYKPRCKASENTSQEQRATHGKNYSSWSAELPGEMNRK